MRIAAHSIEALERRRLFAGTAPESIAGDTFIMDFNGGAEIVNPGVYQVLVAPVSNILFIDNIESNATGYTVVDTYAAGFYSATKTSKSVIKGAVDLTGLFVLPGRIDVLLQFDTNTTGTFLLDDSTQQQTGNFQIVSTTPPTVHFSGDIIQGESEDLTIFGTAGNDVIDVALDSKSRIVTTRNGAVVSRLPLSLTHIV